MKARSTFLLFSALLILVEIGLDIRRDRVAPDAAPAPVAELPVVVDPTTGDQIVRDPAVVFQRAFWRRLGPDVQVLQAERRESKDPATELDRWQWFLALQSTPAFRSWLLESNPFELVRADAETAVVATTGAPPVWFPTAAGDHFTLYRNLGGRMHLWVDPATGRIYATDSGGGFTAPLRPVASN